jgi:hypothetical protein
MTAQNANRAISTAVDTILALVLITASITIMATMLEPQSNDITDEDRAYDEADYIIESLNTIQTSVVVSEENTLSGKTMYTTKREGSLMALLAEATVANARINGGRVMNTNYVIRNPETDEVHNLRERVRNFLAESQTEAHVRTVWDPAGGDTVRGQIDIGPEPPVDEEVSTAKVTYPAGFRGADDIQTRLYAETEAWDKAANKEEFERNHPETVAAAHIVEAYVPPAASQYHIEQDAKALEITEHRYKRMAHLLFRYGGASANDAAAIDAEFNIDKEFTEYPDVGVLNNILIEMLKDNITLDESKTFRTDPMAVKIIVQTW